MTFLAHSMKFVLRFLFPRLSPPGVHGVMPSALCPQVVPQTAQQVFCNFFYLIEKGRMALLAKTCFEKIQTQTNVFCFVFKKIPPHNRLQRTVLILTKHTMRIFGGNPHFLSYKTTLKQRLSGMFCFVKINSVLFSFLF